MPAPGDLDVAGAGNAFRDLTRQLRSHGQIVLEPDDQTGAADLPVGPKPIRNHLKAQLATDRGEVDGRHLEDVEPVPELFLVVECLRGKALDGLHIGRVTGRQFHPAVAQVQFRGRHGGDQRVGSPAARHQHSLPDEFGPGDEQFLNNDPAQGESHDPAGRRAEMLDEARHIRGHVVQGESLGAYVGRRYSPVVERDDPVAGGLQCGDLVRPPHPPRSPGTHDQHDRLPRAVLVIAEIDSVDPSDRHRPSLRLQEPLTCGPVDPWTPKRPGPPEHTRTGPAVIARTGLVP
ncbi:MAG: hypothetical protein QOF84_4833 [Streptomyces sp.]|nr:hypothetical protein [Streptomyces sp.]